MTWRRARSSARAGTRLATALVAAALSLTSSRVAATEPQPSSARAIFVGPECQLRREGPLACEPIERLVVLRGEVAAVQVVFEASAEPILASPQVESGLAVAVERSIFLPVRTRSRGRDPAGEALPWTAAARPPDGSMLGELADPLCPASPEPFEVAGGRREALWLSVSGERAGRGEIVASWAGGGRVALPVEVLDASLPPAPARFFAYVETSELARGAGPEEAVRARDEAFDLVARSGVLPIDRVTDANELAGQLRELAAGTPPRDLVVIGAYGTLGEPTEASVARAVALARAVPVSVEDVILYAIDEQCTSDLGGRWRAALAAAGGEGRRVRVLVTCGDDPARVDAEVVMTPAERFDPAQAAAARARGQEVWVYNGRLPHAGTMALDVPAESLIWQGWIAARYDVRRWFFWNVNHWSDGNRGGLGPRDPYVDPETFHNADGDAVLLDGLLLFPPREEAAARAAGCRPEPRRPLRSARLARLHRGLQDSALLALAHTIEPEAARDALLAVVPAALADVPAEAPSALGSGATIQRARASLHGVIERALRGGPGSPLTREPLTREQARSSLAQLREAAAAHAPTRPPASGARSRTWVFGAAAVAGVGVLVAGWVRARRRAEASRSEPGPPAA